MGAIITLTTDFGTQDAYVAAMKGVILGINPGATLVDICHSIEPQNIAQAAFVIGTAYDYFPQDTIHVVIIDPGVGSQRRAIALKTPRAFFVAPDNGVLSYVIGASPEEPQAVALTNPKFWRHPVSSTFHGRDIFAPVAAHLSLGVPLEEFGEVIPSLFAFPMPHPRMGANGELIGHIIHIDHFGNLITNVKKEDLPSGKLCLEIAGQRIESLSTSYAAGDKLLAVLGSSGHLEIAAKNGSAAGLLGAK
ncbi:MAG TPA: SAM-dependent chlorinase/fluorinase, partial [Dehalococcoidia bacterium]|nr:SAM-dependent chlorinase/fluorinase [Dehalococcoidia bacterium]